MIFGIFLCLDDHPISEKPSVQESANDDNSEEEPFVVAGVERGGTKPVSCDVGAWEMCDFYRSKFFLQNWRIVGLEANAKKKQSVDHGGGGIVDQESNGCINRCSVVLEGIGGPG